MIQIELQPETEARYAAEAEALGVRIEQYIADKLEAAVTPLHESQISIEEKLADLEVFFKEFAKYTD